MVALLVRKERREDRVWDDAKTRTCLGGKNPKSEVDRHAFKTLLLLLRT